MAVKDINALIVFVDIRGFTAWSGKVDNAVFLDEFVQDWYRILDNNFTGFIKHLGDGAMFIQEVEGKTSAKLLKTLIQDILKKIYKINEDFDELCKRFAEEQGTKIPLDLGWGVAKGRVKKMSGDYIGADINKCSRYCDIARPFGIVIDADDFQTLSGPFNREFSKKTRILKGMRDEADVWVTKTIAEQFIPREDMREHPEVHVAGICFKKEKGICSVLLGKRAESRKLYPELYEGCGGQLAYNELFHEGVARHYKKEYHIDITVNKDIFSLYEINTSNEPKIPGIRFLCEYQGGTPFSLNHIPPTPKWFSETEFKALPENDFIPGLKKEIERLLDKYKKA